MLVEPYMSEKERSLRDLKIAINNLPNGVYTQREIIDIVYEDFDLTYNNILTFLTILRKTKKLKHYFVGSKLFIEVE